MTVPSPPSNGFLGLPGELRNRIYQMLLDIVVKDTAPPTTDRPRPINHDEIDFASTPSLRPIIGLFLTSRQISTEARTLYYAFYFPQRHYVLRSRHSIYSFSRAPSSWTQALHQIHLTARTAKEGRKILNPIKVALMNAARADQNSFAMRLEPSYLSLSTGFNHGHTGPVEIDMPYVKFVAKLKLDGLPATLHVLWELGGFEVRFTGPLGRLDWRMIAMMHYTTESAWEQTEARQKRLLQDSPSRGLVHDMLRSRRRLSASYVEVANARSYVVVEMARKIARAMGLQVPWQETWCIDLR